MVIEHQMFQDVDEDLVAKIILLIKSSRLTYSQAEKVLRATERALREQARI